MDYFIKWMGKDTNEKYIKSKLRINPKIAEPLLYQLIILKIGKTILDKVKHGESK